MFSVRCLAEHCIFNENTQTGLLNLNLDLNANFLKHIFIFALKLKLELTPQSYLKSSGKHIPGIQCYNNRESVLPIPRGKTAGSNVTWIQTKPYKMTGHHGTCPSFQKTTVAFLQTAQENAQWTGSDCRPWMPDVHAQPNPRFASFANRNPATELYRGKACELRDSDLSEVQKGRKGAHRHNILMKIIFFSSLFTFENNSS